MNVSIFGDLAAPAAPPTKPSARPRLPGADPSGSRSAIASATFPSDRTTANAPAADETTAREEHIQRSMMNRYMGESINRIPLGVLLCLVMTWVCWRHIPADEVLMWASVVLTGNLVRTLAETNYARRLRDAPCTVQMEFMRRITPIYLVLAAGWGTSPLLFYDRMGDVSEFACWSILAGMMYMPLPRLALVPRLSRLFTSVFFGTAVFCIVFTAWRAGPAKHAVLWFIPLAVLQWSLTRRMTREMHKTQREHYGMVFDLAAQKQEALEAVQTKNRFLAAATHDMRQPVIALSLYAEYLEAYPETHLELAPKITMASTAVNNLFNSLFDLSKFDAGEVHLAVEPVRISEVLEGLFTTGEALAKAKGIELRLRTTDALLQTDKMRLRRMIGNVMSNAIKYSQPGGKVLLAARVRAGKLRVEVWDQGIGIPADQIKNVFAEFYRVEAATKLAPDGMGIGLSLVARLAEALNAKLTIASVEGRGTRVTMEIGDVDPDPENRKLGLDLG